MRVEYGSGAAPAGDLQMQQRFGRRFALWPAASRGARRPLASSSVRDDRPTFVALQYIVWAQQAFVCGAGGDRETERLAREDSAEIAARAEHPAAAVEPA